MLDRFYCWLAFSAPRRLAYWCAVRVGAHASMVLSHRPMPEITLLEAGDAWHQSLERTSTSTLDPES